MIYFGKLKDGTVFERKGSNEEPFEFTTLEGALFYSSALLFFLTKIHGNYLSELLTIGAINVREHT